MRTALFHLSSVYFHSNLVIQRYHDSKETKALNRPLLSLSITRIMDSNYCKSSMLSARITTIDTCFLCMYVCRVLLGFVWTEQNTLSLVSLTV